MDTLTDAPRVCPILRPQDYKENKVSNKRIERMAAPPKLQFADQQHLITIMLDCICERKTVRETYAAARAFLKEVGVDLHHQTLQQYMAKAKEIFNAPYEATRGRMKTNAMKRLDTLYKRCITNGDLSTALKIEKELTLLRGIYKDLDSDDKEQTINISFKDATKQDVANAILDNSTDTKEEE